MKRNFFYLSIFISSLILGQDYAWPTNTGKQLTSNFGEFRDKHFHMGLDIRTRSSIGHPLYAVNDGYIQRIATNFNGYGKALYLKTNDDKIVVYGHLSLYTKDLENRLFDLQNENQSYFVTKYFMEDEILVQRGQVIGYSGNSGGSMGPHLHFELRNEHDQPLNPMTYGFPLNDNIPPKFLGLSIISLSLDTHINGSALPQIYIPLLETTNAYTLIDTITVTGKFGIATHLIDKIQNAIHSYQIEKVELLVDSISVFSVQYNLLDFNERENISTVYGQPVNHPMHDDFQKLYRLEPYPKLTIHNDDKNGIINLTEGLHKIEIHAWDSAHNKSTLAFYVKSDVLSQKHKYNTTLNLNYYPTFNNNGNVFNPEIIQLEKGAIFQLHTDIVGTDKIMAYIEKPDVLLTFPLVEFEAYKYSSGLINPFLFTDSERCGFLIYSDTIQKYEFEFLPELIFPKSNTTVFSNDSLCSVTFENVYYDTMLTWLTKQTTPLKINSINRKTNFYKLNPNGIPFKNDAIVSMTVSKETNMGHCAIYTFNKKKSKWDFERSSIDTINNFIYTKLSKSNIFAVFEDKKPPHFLYTYPKHRQTYSKNVLKKFIINLNDDLSGINPSEEHLKVYLDGKRIWVAYQPVEKEISYVLRSALPIGEHYLSINIQDRSGNSASKSIKFFVE